MTSTDESREEFIFKVYLGLSFMLMIFTVFLFIFRRLNLNEMFHIESSSSAPIPTPAPSALIQKVFNPFFLQVSDDKDDKKSVSLTITSHKSCIIHIAWGPKISNIYPLIHSGWELFANNEFLVDNLRQLSLSYEQIKLDLTRDEPSPMKNFKLTRPSLNFGPPPRPRYPLVIILIDDWLVNAVTDIQSTNEIGSLISLVHLKDDVCPSNTHVFDQYVKTHCGTLHNIKPVYVSSSDVLHSEHETTSSSSQPSSLSRSSLSQPVASSSSPTATAKNNSTEYRNADKCEKDKDKSNKTTAVFENNDDALFENDFVNNDNEGKTIDQSFCCCVCLANRISRVLLPCRHACVCAPCCGRLLYCPICRNVISRTFDLD